MTMPTDTDFNERELERMAEQRVEIEEKLAEQRREEAKYGSVATARCIKFDHRKPTLRATNEHVAFTFEFPDGNKTTKYADIGELDDMLDCYNAGSVTDMIGAKHDCIYTADGWKLLNSTSTREWLFWTYATGEGHVYRFPWPILLSVTFPVWFAAILAGGLANPGLAALLSVLFLATMGVVIIIPLFSLTSTKY